LRKVAGYLTIAALITRSRRRHLAARATHRAGESKPPVRAKSSVRNAFGVDSRCWWPFFEMGRAVVLSREVVLMELETRGPRKIPVSVTRTGPTKVVAAISHQHVNMGRSVAKIGLGSGGSQPLAGSLQPARTCQATLRNRGRPFARPAMPPLSPSGG
jgi:hypothetical protein